jgi:hypothetical protein
MPSDLQITNIRDQANANSAITIASDGQITVNQNNPTLALGSNATGFTGPKVADVWRLNTTFAGLANPITNLTRATNTNDGVIGSAMTTPAHGETNAGVFTFPMPGIYQIVFKAMCKIQEANLNLTYAGTCINKVISGTTTAIDQCYSMRAATSSTGTFYFHNISAVIFDCTDTTTDKVSFGVNDLSSTSVNTIHGTTSNLTAMLFTRIGDT